MTTKPNPLSKPLNVFHAPRGWLTRKINIALVGCGGTGSQVLTSLAQLHHALVELGHEGLDVTVFDDDKVESFNVGRQPFYPADVGYYKAQVLIHRINVMYGTRWEGVPERFTGDDKINDLNLIIGCVDTKSSRRAIHNFLKDCYSEVFWLDFGNQSKTGQIVLGSMSQKTTVGALVMGERLPVVTELFPEILDESIPEPADVPSCSMRDALKKQSLFINREMANQGMAILWDLLTVGHITRHGAFVDLAHSRVNPMPIKASFWSSMNITVEMPEQTAMPCEEVA
jgi:PRTRC genetic system ThiF family protein